MYGNTEVPAWLKQSLLFGKNTEMGCPFLFQGKFLTQESNLHFLHSLPADPSGKQSYKEEQNKKHHTSLLQQNYKRYCNQNSNNGIQRDTQINGTG